MKNRSVLFTAPDRVEYGAVESDIQPLGAHDVLLRTQYSLVSAATELACLGGGERWFGFPGTPGYASVGEVVEVGAEVSDFASGDMVYSMGRHWQYHVVDTANPRGLCVKVPAGMDMSKAVFARLAVVAFTALRISTIELGDWVGVVGLGVVGNLAAQLARLQGGRVIGLDINSRRVEVARQCGIEHALLLDPATVEADVAEISGGQKLSTLIEATGLSHALPPALPLVGRYGEVILLGTPRGAFDADLTDILSFVHLDGRGNQTFKGAHEWRYPVKRDAFLKHSIERNAELSLELIRDGALRIDPLHTHTLHPQDAARAYHGLRDEKDTFVGVVFDWTGV